MAIDATNQDQADFWTAAGTMWTKLRDRFDQQVDEHGLAAIDALDPAAGETVLDIGCGAGTSTLQIAERVGGAGHVRGVDISPTMVDGATARARDAGVDNVEFAVADAMVEHFEGDMDAVFSRFGVMFFSDAGAGFRNIRSALRPGGRLGFVCWQSPTDNPWASGGFEQITKYVDIPFGGDPTAPGPFSLGDPDRLGSVLDGAGFAEVSITSRETPVHMGADAEDAARFFAGISPPATALQQSDPDKAAALHTDLVELFSAWDGPDGVRAPAAVWIVTAQQPD